MVEFYGENKKNKRATKAATNYIGIFESKVDEIEESLKKRLHDLGIEAYGDDTPVTPQCLISELTVYSSKQDSDFTEAFQEAYAASRPLPSAVHGESKARSKDISFATLFDRSQEMIEDAKLIVEKFDNACQKTSRVKTLQLADNDWEHENVQTAQILAIGHQVGLDKYEAMLTGSSGPDIDEEDSVSASLIYPENEGNMTVPWGTIAKKSEKTMRKFLKAIFMEPI